MHVDANHAIFIDVKQQWHQKRGIVCTVQEL